MKSLLSLAKGHMEYNFFVDFHQGVYGKWYALWVSTMKGMVDEIIIGFCHKYTEAEFI